ERDDWIPRARTILEHGTAKTFLPFDRFAFRTNLSNLDLEQRLELFERERAARLEDLAALEVDAEDLDRRGMHPELGEVTLGELLATWVTHDLTHMAQIARVMARRYRHAVGPWKQYLSILGD
ncbi:MAG: DinB family protein, partial [Planctomycetota bacterium]